MIFTYRVLSQRFQTVIERLNDGAFPDPQRGVGCNGWYPIITIHDGPYRDGTERLVLAALLSVGGVEGASM